MTGPTLHEQLIALALGELSATEAHELEARVAALPAAAADLAAVRSMLDDLRAAQELIPLLHVSRAQRDRLVGIAGSAEAGLLTRLTDGLREVIAGLVFDSRTAAIGTAGYRGASESRHLHFEAEDFELDLQILSAKPPGSMGRIELMGQVTSTESFHRVVFRSVVGTNECQAEISQTGEFRAALDQATFIVRIEADERSVSIPQLDLEAGR